MASLIAVAVLGAGAADAQRTTKVKIRVAKAKDVGKVLVDAERRTLYTFTDEDGVAVACEDACAVAWPPLLAPEGSKLKVVRRAKHLDVAIIDGHVASGGLPLYRYAGDTKRRQARGEGLASFGGTWHVVSVSKHTVSTVGSPGNVYDYYDNGGP